MKFQIILSLLIVISFSYQISACTGFTAFDNGTILVGNNEDLSLLAEPILIINPPSSNSYGGVVFYCKWPFPFNSGSYAAFGGMNDQGLFFDIYSTPYHQITNQQHKPTYNQDIFDLCIRTCATVEEVVTVFDSYYIPYMEDIQGFFVDKYGNSVIIEGDHFIYKKGEFQVVTNFLQSRPELGGYPCLRYETAYEMLENASEVSMEFFVDICNAVHVEGITLPTFKLDTIYSNIYDLNNGVMYLYFFHDYTNRIEIKIPEIFEHGYQRYDVPSLFITNSSHQPNKPAVITGQTQGKINQEYEYSTVGSDDDNDLLFYFYDWGDESNSGWIGYYSSGETCTVTHAWSEQGSYEIKVKTKDITGLESEWSESLTISMPKYRNDNLIQSMIQKIYNILNSLDY